MGQTYLVDSILQLRQTVAHFGELVVFNYRTRRREESSRSIAARDGMFEQGWKSGALQGLAAARVISRPITVPAASTFLNSLESDLSEFPCSIDNHFHTSCTPGKWYPDS